MFLGALPRNLESKPCDRITKAQGRLAFQGHERPNVGPKTLKKFIFSIEKLLLSIKKLIISIEKADISIEKVIIFIKKTNVSIEKLFFFIEKEAKMTHNRM